MRGTLFLFDILGGPAVDEVYRVNRVEMALNACEAVLYAVKVSEGCIALQRNDEPGWPS